LAIECDGASYHSAPTARDRDRLRQQHLESLGWRFLRIGQHLISSNARSTSRRVEKPITMLTKFEESANRAIPNVAAEAGHGLGLSAQNGNSHRRIQWPRRIGQAFLDALRRNRCAICQRPLRYQLNSFGGKFLSISASKALD